MLIVEPDATRRRQLAAAAGSRAIIDAGSDFATARALLKAHRPDVLVSNLRLGEYNGLHLVYAAAALGLKVRSIVYTIRHEAGFCADVESSGATYDTFDHVTTSIADQLSAAEFSAPNGCAEPVMAAAANC